MEGDPRYFHEFHMDAMLPRMQGALTYDVRLTAWLPKLVPKKVSEHEFWRNYFSHIAAIVHAAEAGQHILAQHNDTAAANSNSGSVPARAAQNHVPLPSAAPSSAASVSTHTINVTPNTVPVIPVVSPANTAAMPAAVSTVPATAIHQLSYAAHNIQLSGAQIRWGVIGGSYADAVIIPCLKQTAGCSVQALCRRNTAAAKEMAQRHGISRVYSNLKQLLDDAEVEAIYIASPPHTHAAYALEVAASRKPCVMETPLARNHEEAVSIVEEFMKFDTPLYTGFWRRTTERARNVKAMLDSEAIGTVTAINYVLTK